MARPKGGNAYEVLNCRVPPGLSQRISDHANMYGLRVRDVISEALQAYLDGSTIRPMEVQAEALIGKAAKEIEKGIRLLETILHTETSEQRQARLFKDVLYELSLLIDEFGYEAVYFGVGCEAFPDAVDPWSGDGQY